MKKGLNDYLQAAAGCVRPNKDCFCSGPDASGLCRCEQRAGCIPRHGIDKGFWQDPLPGLRRRSSQPSPSVQPKMPERSRVVPLCVGSDHVVPLTVGNERVAPLTVETIFVPLSAENVCTECGAEDLPWVGKCPSCISNVPEGILGAW